MSELDASFLNAVSDLSGRWLIGVSGGRDSVALLDACARSSKAELVLCHVNHGLRGGASDGDEVFVRELAQRYRLPMRVRRVDVATRAAEEKCGLETAARSVRQEFFAECCEELSAQGVLLAHHADDQAETILHHLLRGAAGLRGMSREQELLIGDRELRCLRPLLGVRRADIDGYVGAHQLAFREDASNAEPFTVRNRIRAEVLPLLNKVMDRDVVPTLNRAAELRAEEEQMFDSMLEDVNWLDPQGRVFLPALVSLPRVLQMRALKHYLQDHHVPDLGRDLLEASVALLDPSSPAKINLPGGRWLRRKEKRVFISE